MNAAINNTLLLATTIAGGLRRSCKVRVHIITRVINVLCSVTTTASHSCINSVQRPKWRNATEIRRRQRGATAGPQREKCRVSDNVTR